MFSQCFTEAATERLGMRGAETASLMWTMRFAVDDDGKPGPATFGSCAGGEENKCEFDGTDAIWS